MKTIKLATVLPLALLLGACSGGHDDNATTEEPASHDVAGYAIDDFVIDGVVRFYVSGNSTVMHETRTAALGRFTIPAQLASGVYRIEITDGFEDEDGQSETLSDRKPFKGKLSALIELGATRHAVLVNAISTGLVAYAGDNLSQYNRAQAALPAEITSFILASTSDITSTTAQHIAALQRGLGFESLVAELADDGQFNASLTSLGNAQLVSSARAATATGESRTIADLNFKLCLAESLGKDVNDITQSDLEAITRLNCDERGIRDLAGISALVNLRFLHLENNSISDLSPLGSLPALSLVNVRNNRVVSLVGARANRSRPLAMMVAENCIANPTELNDDAQFVFSGFDPRAKRQFSNCEKNDAEALVFSLRRKDDGDHVLIYRTSYNALAQCEIDWGDGTVVAAACDGRTHYVDHRYTVTTPVPLTLKVNGNAKRVLTVSLHAVPQPVLSIDMDEASLTRLGAINPTSTNFQFVAGFLGRPAVQFGGFGNPGVIRIPNEPRLQFDTAASFDFWVRIDYNGGMNGWGDLSVGADWGMALLAKSHDRIGAALNLYAGGGVHFQTYDPSWSGDCRTVATPVLVLGQWFRVTVVADQASGTRYYINKTLITECPGAHPDFSQMNQQDLYIGRFSDFWYPLHGAVQDVRIYNQALSTEAITNLP